jgi:hypothetical protein
VWKGRKYWNLIRAGLGKQETAFMRDGILL